MRKKLNPILHLFSHSHPFLIISLELTVGMSLCIGSLFIFVEIADHVLQKQFLDLDTNLSYFVYSFRSPLLTEIMRLISYLGAEFIALVSVIIGVILIMKKRVNAAIVFLTVIVMGYALNTIIKYLLKVPRPDINPIYDAGFYSFPSGHAMMSTIFYLFLAYAVYHKTRDVKLGIVALSLFSCVILLVGLSRVYLGVHYPSDILAGYIAGFWWCSTVALIGETKILHTRLRKTHKHSN